ncbi:hypothetical protein EV126DRAFT_429537 [Verticillium dahliae]|nr:hypothetical protein EV126DRAFT_429537 [Verticillium dahliae]
MASLIARRAFTTSLRRMTDQGKQQITQDSKRNPETFILGGVMVFALAGAGFYFGSSPTKSTSETHVVKAGSPWETGSKEGAYRYHPGGDTSNEPRDAPSAVNTVVVPNVTLPAVRPFSPSLKSAEMRRLDRERLAFRIISRGRKRRINANGIFPGAPREVQQVGQGRLPLSVSCFCTKMSASRGAETVARGSQTSRVRFRL